MCNSPIWIATSIVRAFASCPSSCAFDVTIDLPVVSAGVSLRLRIVRTASTDQPVLVPKILSFDGVIYYKNFKVILFYNYFFKVQLYGRCYTSL